MTLTVLMLLTAGCTKITGPFVGDWAYIHDPATSVLVLKTNGSAVYEGASYTYTTDDTYIHLTDSNGEQLMRYQMDGEKMNFYKTTTYKYAGEGTPDGLVGMWTDEADKWSYEFTSEGTFMEDKIFPGYYSADESEGVIKLVYNDQFEDAFLYYTLEGDTLTIEYPWPLVRTTKDDGKTTK